MSLIKRPRIKDSAHLEFIRSLPCCCCGDNTSTEAAHIRKQNLDYGKRGAGGAEKPDDVWTVPLCGDHHKEQHTMSEDAFWASYGINQFVLAMSLYLRSGDYEMAITILERQGYENGHHRRQREATASLGH
jgi:hypothetical protein